MRSVVFTVPTVADAVELQRELAPDWTCWVENRIDGVFVVLATPARPDELERLISRARAWVTRQDFVALRVELDGRAYALGRDGLVGAIERG
ncbi:MAG: hypothetical protein ACJ74M_03130 [Gaiellaceae bacterium]